MTSCGACLDGVCTFGRGLDGRCPACGRVLGPDPAHAQSSCWLMHEALIQQLGKDLGGGEAAYTKSPKVTDRAALPGAPLGRLIAELRAQLEGLHGGPLPELEQDAIERAMLRACELGVEHGGRRGR